MVEDIYPDSNHVRNLSAERAADDGVWRLAQSGGYTVVTKDADFQELSVLEGFPPKIIWIRRGNCSTAVIADLLRSSHKEIIEFHFDLESSCLVLF